MDLSLMLYQAILANELDGNSDAAWRFSDPDGVNRGKSGWSFGLCQFDVANNPAAILCLRECGFTTDEIARLKNQTMQDMTAMNAKLRAAAWTVKKWDQMQLAECLTVPMTICSASGIVFANDEAKIHVADYHNQFYMSRGGKLHCFLKERMMPIVPEMILQFKLGLPWGKKAPDDVHRRYDNIARLFRAKG